MGMGRERAAVSATQMGETENPKPQDLSNWKVKVAFSFPLPHSSETVIHY